MIRETVNAVLAALVTFVLCAVAYPAVVLGVGQLALPRQAEGSLVWTRDGRLIGSDLIAQPFASPRYFSPRPSAVDYDASAAGGSNLATTNPDQAAKIADRARALGATTDRPAPIELVTASGSGLDPDLGPEAARYQAARVASARGVEVSRVIALIDRLTDRSGLILGHPERVNVLRLNLALDGEIPVERP